MGDRDLGEVRYRAFLSYSHKDAAAAGRLHRRLEAYRIPRRLVGRETPAGPVPARLWPIFRDREELPAATDLSETVRAALAQSGALIILCSPNAPESLWVAEEIRVFRELHPDRPILAAILEGDPPDCFPELLRAFGRTGTSRWRRISGGSGRGAARPAEAGRGDHRAGPRRSGAAGCEPAGAARDGGHGGGGGGNAGDGGAGGDRYRRAPRSGAAAGRGGGA